MVFGSEFDSGSDSIGGESCETLKRNEKEPSGFIWTIPFRNHNDGFELSPDCFNPFLRFSLTANERVSNPSMVQPFSLNILSCS